MDNDNHKLNLTTLTPVFIGSDQGLDLSATTDFIVDSDKIKIIDQRKIETILSKDVELINEFVSEVKNYAYSFNLKNFIENKLNTSVEGLTKGTIDIDGTLGSNSISTHISTVGKPYIPGSSIKGAIRTAIIYNFLSASSDGKKI